MVEILDILKLSTDRQIYWSGDPIQELGITKQMRYNEAIKKLSEAFLEYKNAKFDFGSLATGSDVITSRDEIINSVVSKVTNLGTSDISHSGNAFNNNRLSTEAGKYIGTKFAYSISSGSEGAKLGVNINDENFDADVLSTRVVVSGKSESGMNVFMDTPEKISSVDLKNEMYPITLDIVKRIQTKTGTIDLTKNITLHNPSESGDFQKEYDVKDRSFSAPFAGKLNDWLGSIEATQNRLEQYHDALKHTDSGDIINTVSENSYAISSLKNNLNELKTVNVSLSGSDGRTTTKNMSLQDAFDSVNKSVNNLLVDNTQLKSDLTAAQNRLSNISNPSGGGIAGTTIDAGSSFSTGVAVGSS